MLTKLHIQGFGSCKNVRFNLLKGRQAKSQLIILGEHSTGKTSLFKALELLVIYLRGYCPEHREITIRNWLSADEAALCDFVKAAIREDEQKTEMDYCFLHHGLEFSLTLRFNHRGYLIHEVCSVRKGEKITKLFEITKQQYFLHGEHFSTAQLLLIHACRDRWKHHGLAAFLYHERKKKVRFSREVNLFLEQLEKISVDYMGQDHSLHSVIYEGLVFRQDQAALDDMEQGIALMFRKYCPWVKSVKYIRDLTPADEIWYRLSIQETSGNWQGLAISGRRLYHGLISTYLNIMRYLSGMIVGIDDFDLYFDEFLSAELLSEIPEARQGQWLCSCSKTLIMKTDPARLYLIDPDDHGINCLTDLLLTQKNHNNRLRYEKGIIKRRHYPYVGMIQEKMKAYFTLLKGIKKE